MLKRLLLTAVSVVVIAAVVAAQAPYETDTIKTSAGDLEITFIGHGTLMFSFGGKVIHVDPVSRSAGA